MNFSIYSKYIKNAAEQGCKMVFLPEGFDFIGQNRKETFELAESIDGPIISKIKNLAKNEKIWISLGGFHQVFT